MTTPSNWTFDGQLDTSDDTSTTPDQERAKIAALFGKGQEASSTDGMDYLAAFEEHKKGKQVSSNPQDKVQVQYGSPDEDIAASYKEHLKQRLVAYEEDMVHYRGELDRLQELVTGKETSIKTIKAIMTAMDTLV